jgi:hypothetical protein
MYLLGQLVCIGRDDGARLDRSLRTFPLVPKAGERERFVVAHVVEVRLLHLATRGLPLVVAVRQDQAALPLERRPKRRLGRHSLAAGVDEGLPVLRPGRHQTPAHQHALAMPVMHANRCDRLRRRDVVARAARNAIDLEQRGVDGRIGVAHESAAHGSCSSRVEHGRATYQTRPPGRRQANSRGTAPCDLPVQLSARFPGRGVRQSAP